ncbi:MAG: rhomboid family intramembrane serine protease [Haloferacaceae archaeon]
MAAVPDGALLGRAALAVAAAVAAAVVIGLDRPRGRWGRRLRRRLLLGVPWGTLVTGTLVLLVYLLLQGGLDHPRAPTTLPFRAWSYLYPLGVVTASFAHAGPGHLAGNLVGTLALAPLAEYAWGHYPRERGATSFGSPRTNPFVRAFVCVPAAAVGVGLATAAFGLGPVIGFSGVVFAFGGAALVYYPIRTVVALSAADLLRVAVRAVRTPTTTAAAEPSFSSPWWAGIAIQGHALGLLLGVLAAVGLLRARGDDPPSALRTFGGVALFGAVQSLWAVYWFRGGGTFVLYRAVGLSLVILLAALVAAAVAASDRPLVGDGPAGASLRSVPRWTAASVVLLLVVSALAGPAAVTNLAAASDEPLPGEAVTVRDYEVTYAENVENGMVSVVDVEAFGEETTVNTSGVIVRSERRELWMTAVRADRLAFAGRATVRLGGVGWRERVVANRTGWTAVGGPTTYRVTLRHGGRRVPAFTAPPAEAAPVIAGRNVSVVARPGGFGLAVRVGERNRTAPLPPRNGSVRAGGLRFVRNGSRVVAVRGETRVPVARREAYR